MNDAPAPANSGPGYAKTSDHKIDISKAAGTVTVRFKGAVVAQSANALELRETNYPPVIYFPRDAVSMSAVRSETSSYCPFKGEASYWRFGTDEDIAWSYETPYDEVAEIAGYLAFYPDRVDPAD